ncbi:hypothetical protein BDY24DRAFT_442210 [Mrakia frigida]|uniref:zinc-binding alcohol dehydrogenase family protein n=1 Tax=Mrakia frigida TaxID=29902 RepID=UPI003FCBFEDF
MMNIPQKMHALATTTDGKNINEGSPIQDVVKIREENIPEVRDYETLVEVRYIAVGPADVTCLRIQNRDTTPGFDLSGIVVKDKSGRFKEGDRVFGMVYGGLGSTLKDDKLRKQYQDNGSFATYAVVHSDMLARCPDKKNCLVECAALPFCTLTAYQAFDLKNWPSQAKSHESILICGGSTLIGLSAIQIAHRMGYKVLTTTSENNFQLCKDYGADQCYNFKDQDVDRQIQEHTQNALNFAIDAVGQGNSLTVAYKSMGAKGGQISTVIPRDQKEESQASGRNDITVRMKLPTTLWGHEAQWDGVDFKPSHNEHDNTKAFFKDFQKWIQEDKCKCLPTRLQKEHGLDGVLRAMEEVRRNPTPGARMVVCVKDH